MTTNSSLEGNKTLIIVGGPTASGKTALAIRLARHYGTEVLSADSRQFYREMSIGTAKPTPEELQQVKHHFIDSLSIGEAYTVGDFERDALKVLDEIFQTHSVAVVTGGSGLYLKALCEGLDAFPETPVEVRDALETLYLKKGLGALQEELRTADPVYYHTVDLKNPHRLIRALAVCRVSGQPFSSFRKKQFSERSFRPIYLELSWERAELYRRIDQRVLGMMENGLLEEARTLLPHENLTALQTVGYQELFPYLQGETTLEEAVSLIQQNSRRYAKRQLTWSRRDGFWKHVHPSEWTSILQYLDFSISGLISWRQESFIDQDKGREQESLRLVIQTPDRLLAEVHYQNTRKGLALTPAEYPGEELARWLLHEMIYRAEGKPLTALLDPEWEPLLEAFAFRPLTRGEMNSVEAALAGRYPLVRPWKKG
ncbi:MAG: tRNA (adenosine(37)-N6)-dimethylallyltransferase MiaA [Haliscomenobacter sp.]|nr:tRNA (adenosine(37)-N6)-dimethylallyltransferase MiaA [Haliscomenobacter sp.]